VHLFYRDDRQCSRVHQTSNKNTQMSLKTLADTSQWRLKYHLKTLTYSSDNNKSVLHHMIVTSYMGRHVYLQQGLYHGLTRCVLHVKNFITFSTLVFYSNYSLFLIIVKDTTPGETPSTCIRQSVNSFKTLTVYVLHSLMIIITNSDALTSQHTMSLNIHYNYHARNVCQFAKFF